MTKKIIAADMFCGAGGMSEGLKMLCDAMGWELELTALNHWDRAIETHSANHPYAKHILEDIGKVDPRKAVPGGYLDILLAGPKCQHFSRARGDKPVNEQQRSHAMSVIDWAENLYIRTILIENVPEFCFPAETAVLSKRGLVPIGELQIGDEVWTHNARWKPITAISRRTASTVRVRGYGNSIVECTANHQFYARQLAPKITQSGKYGRHETCLLEPEWVRADCLADKNSHSAYTEKHSGWAWATPIDLPRYWMRMPDTLGIDTHAPAFFYMIGRWLGDGWIRKRNKRQDLVRICASKVEADSLEKHLQETGLTWHRSSHTNSVDVFDLCAEQSRILGRWLVANFGQYAHKKTLPAWIYGASDERKWALIEGYCDADGHEQEGKILISSVSRCLAVGIRLLLQSLGISASVSRTEARLSPGVVNPDKMMNCREVFSVSWRRESEWEKCFRSERYLWGRVRDVTPCRESVEVVDITVADDHSFVADGQVVHNCTWGPVGRNGKPLKSKKGEMYRAFLHMLRALGYRVDARVLVCADYGDPTTRERLFIIARRDTKPLVWPEPTHSRDGAPTLWGPMKKWVPARDIIDWSLSSESIFARKVPLKPNTIRRIVAGLRKFSGLPFVIGQQSNAAPRSVDDPVPTVATAGAIRLAEPEITPFVLPPEGIHRGNAPRSVDQPLPTVTASRGAGHLVQPYLIVFNGQSDAVDVDKPVPTVVTQNHLGLVEPFLVMMYGTGTARSVDEPAPTVTASGEHIALAEVDAQPFLALYHGSNRPNGDRVRSVDDPVPTVAAEGVQIALVEPFIMSMEHSKAGADAQVRGIDRPFPTVTSGDGFGVVEPFIVATNHGSDTGRCWPVSEPLRTVTGVDAWGLVESFLINYNGNGRPQSVDEPLDTVTTVDRFGLVMMVGNQHYLLDIRFRMLQPQELARAQGFRETYEFRGNRRDRVKQIGNAVPNHTSCALCRALLVPGTGKATD